MVTFSCPIGLQAAAVRQQHGRTPSCMAAAASAFDPAPLRQITACLPKTSRLPRRYKWLLPRRGCVRGLTLITETEEDWLAAHLVLGLVATGLERLVVRAGREG